MAIQSAGYINHYMHGRKPAVRTAHTTFPWALIWGRLICTLPDAASPGDSWAHPELHYCLGSELLGSPKATVEAVGPRQCLGFPHHQDKAWRGARRQLWSVHVATEAVKGGSSSHPRSDLKLVTLLAPALPFLHSLLTTASPCACFP